MAYSYTANFVDRLLMKLDGSIAPIWNRLFLVIDKPIDETVLVQSFRQLILETPRLRSLWVKDAQQWHEQSFATIQARIKLPYDRELFSTNERIRKILANRDNSLADLPVRLSYGAVSDHGQEASLLTLEFHHGAGDGHSVILLIKRFWQILEHALHSAPLNPTPISQPELTDGMIIKRILKQPGQFLKLAKSENRQLARRASPLKHEAQHIGLPTLLSFKVNKGLLAELKPSSLFYAAILAAIIRLEDQDVSKNIRLRVPVDVRQPFNLSFTSIGNACSAIIVEFDLQEMRSLFYANPQRMIQVIEAKFKQQLRSELYIANALECLLASKIASQSSMHHAAPQELLGNHRSSSLVITFMGEVSHLITPPQPFNLLDVRSHTPVWGVNGFIYQDNMHINLSCFEGIWPPEVQQQFSQYIIDFLTRDSIIDRVVT
ncbi:hypothetical protein [Legionella shakespearei]|uniref:Condensation domain-containing protein n=1 Tax=Legionella shakespearei DSM 23087 TaxID=1122169 RepID=A0A0W0YJY9_9GAMM|nr:hypothetical protein [Legionella shakespearei]KTD57225.1 hypothetical protein Lsha_2607 [Legionella shakespearei DSM 23087]